MTTLTVAQNIDLWEAWIDVQASGKDHSATIFVIGDVMVNNLILEPRFKKCPPPPGKEGRLTLEIIPNVICDDGTEIEIMYAEEMVHINQYSGVSIFLEGSIFVEIDDLEIIY